MNTTLTPRGCPRDQPGGHRVPSVVLCAAAMVLGLATAACRTDSTPHADIIIGATATANEPGLAIGPSVNSIIESAVDRGTVRLQVFIGSQSDQPAVDSDVSVYYNRATGEVDTDPQRLQTGFAKNMTPIDQELANAASNESNLDLLTLLDSMADTPGPATLLVYSSGLQTTGLLNLRNQGSDLDVAATVARIPSNELPDLAGKHVIFIGLGQVAGPQPRLTLAMTNQVKDLWLTVCRRAKGMCDADVLPSTGGAPKSTVAVPTIPVPALKSIIVSHNPDGTSQTTIRLPDAIFFRPNSATLLPTATRELRNVVTYFLPAAHSTPVRATAIGHCASYGTRAGALTLSRERARTLVAALIDAGVSRSLFTEVSGVGFDDLIVPDLDQHDRLIPDAAENNRTVVLTVTSRGEK